MRTKRGLPPKTILDNKVHDGVRLWEEQSRDEQRGRGRGRSVERAKALTQYSPHSIGTNPPKA